jgi:hypothetical protein
MNQPEYVPPEAWIQCAEKRELLRVAAVSALERSRGGRDLIPDARAWAQHWASMPPLKVPMSDGMHTNHVHEGQA